MKHNITRRTALQLGTGLMTAGLIAPIENLGAAPNPESKETIRVGFVGIGVKGSQHFRNLLHIDGVDLRLPGRLSVDRRSAKRPHTGL